MNRLIIALLLIFAPLIILNSCGGHGQNYIQVTLNNPSPGAMVTPATSPAKYIGFELAVKVKTLVNGVSTDYDAKTISFLASTTITSLFTATNVKIPSSGSYTVEYTLKSLDCSLYTTTCSSNKGKASYYDIKAFATTQTAVTFIVGPGQINGQICC